MNAARPISPTAPPLRLSTVDERLGDSRSRFFGAGFRRVRYDVTGLLTSVTDSTITLLARASLRYPQDWSRKSAGRDLRPHFSSLDAMIMSVAVVQFATAVGFDLPVQSARSSALRDLKVTAGSTPIEDLADLPVSLDCRVLPDRTGRTGSAVSFDCRVATMRIRGTLEVGFGRRLRNGEFRHEAIDSVLGPAAERYYGLGFTTRRQEIVDIEIDPALWRAVAELRVVDDAGEDTADDTGPGVVEYPASEIDLFVTALQLAQVMLYDLDGLTRSRSETLWMRSIAATVDHTRSVEAGPTPVVTELRNSRTVQMAGGTWRTADIVANTGAVALRVGVTHRIADLPAVGT